MYNGEQLGLLWCPAAGGPTAGSGGAYLCMNLTFELSQFRGSREPLGAAASGCCYLCAAAPGCKVWLPRGWETISEDRSGHVRTNRALRKDSGLSRTLKEGCLRSWQLWHHGAGSGMDTQVHPVTVGILRGRGMAPVLSGAVEVLPAELCRGGGSPARPCAMSWDQPPEANVFRVTRMEVRAPVNKRHDYLLAVLL